MDREGARRVGGAVMLDVSGLTPPDGRRFWITQEMLPITRQGQVKPVFAITQLAKVFFARSADWVRWLSSLTDEDGLEEVFTLDGEPLVIQRTDAGNRFYTLVDVERVTHALLEHGRIDVQQFIGAINILKWMAFQYRILDERDMAVPRMLSPQPGEQVAIPGIDEEIERLKA